MPIFAGISSPNRAERISIRQVAMLRGEEWRPVRATFTPIFTSGKLKAMAGIISEVADKLAKCLEAKADSGEYFEAKVECGKFSMDSIASCAFGVDARSFEDGEESPFIRNGNAIFKRNRGAEK